MEATDIRDDLVDELARILNVERSTLQRDLSDGGPEWPFDSIVLVEVLVAVEQELGITVPMDTRTAGALRSLTGLAERLAELSEEHGAP